MAESEKASRRSAKGMRCAIYARKSSEEGLEQAFNSLDAQRETCPAGKAAVVIQCRRDRPAFVLLGENEGYKKGTRYRFYVSRSLIIGTAKDRSKGRRIPAANLESLVISRLQAFLSDQGAILDAIRDEYADGIGQKRLIGRGRQISEGLGRLAPDQTRAMMMTLLSRVDIRPDRVEITVRRGRLVELLGAQPFEATTEGGKSDKESEEVLTLTVMARLQRVGREMRMLVENTDDQTMADPGLLRIVARAHDIQERLMQNNDLTVHVKAPAPIANGYSPR